MSERGEMPSTGKPNLQAMADYLFGYVCRHLVCLAFRYVELDAEGNPKGKERFIGYSGFIMSIKGMWFLVTAGHVLKDDLDDNLRAKKIRIISCAIADYYGKDAKVHLPTPFDYDEHTIKGSIDDTKIGLDLGLIYLRQLYRDGLSANGIIPVTEENWNRQHEVEFEAYYLLGFPKELVDKETAPVDPNELLLAKTPAVLIPVRRITDRADIPSTVELPESELPWFVGQMFPANPPNIRGMSGGPILGLRSLPNGGLEYWVVALQSRVYERSKIILGCPVPIFATIVEEIFREYGMNDDNIA